MPSLSLTVLLNCLFQQQPLSELLAKYEATGVTSLSMEEIVRLKRTYSKDQIKTANLAIMAEKNT